MRKYTVVAYSNDGRESRSLGEWWGFDPGDAARRALTANRDLWTGWTCKAQE